MKWFGQYKTWIKLVKDSSIGITEFHFLNKDGDEIELS
jgi:ribonuclease G